MSTGGHCGNPHRTAKLSLPDGVSLGVIIGPGGDNFKWVVRETGVRFVSLTNERIILAGGLAQVAAARRLLAGQIQALQEADERGTLENLQELLQMNCLLGPWISYKSRHQRAPVRLLRAYSAALSDRFRRCPAALQSDCYGQGR